MTREKEGKWEQVNPVCYADRGLILEALLKYMKLSLFRKADLDHYGQQVVEYEVRPKEEK